MIASSMIDTNKGSVHSSGVEFSKLLILIVAYSSKRFWTVDSDAVGGAT